MLKLTENKYFHSYFVCVYGLKTTAHYICISLFYLFMYYFEKLY